MTTTLSWPFKDPLETADYDIDWSGRMYTGDAIVSYTQSLLTTDSPVSTALVIQSSSFLPTRSKVWLTAGTLGFTYIIENTVTTTNGDILVESIKLQIKQK